jgi:hypothetical protein
MNNFWEDAPVFDTGTVPHHLHAETALTDADRNLGFLFSLGEVRITEGAHLALADEPVEKYLARHAIQGEWGEFGGDASANAAAVGTANALVYGGYRLRTGARIWIVTYQGAYTTVMLPSEY